MDINSISSLFLFNGMTPEEISSLMDKCPDKATVVRKADFSQGEVISRGGEICYVLRGNADIRVSETGDAILRTVGPGDCFGAGMLYSDSSFNSTVAVAKSHASVLFIPRSTVDFLINASPLTAKNYLTYLSGKIAFLNRRITAFSAGDTETKLAVYLYQLSTLSDDPEKILIKDPYTSIAKKLSMGRASLYRTLDSFENSGIIKRQGSYISILKLDELLKIIKN